MRRNGLLLATLLTLVLTGWTLGQTGWRGLFKAATAHTARVLKGHGPFAGDAAWNWRNCGPRHWRMLLLQR
jgi:hypothetical protein